MLIINEGILVWIKKWKKNKFISCLYLKGCNISLKLKQYSLLYFDLFPYIFLTSGVKQSAKKVWEPSKDFESRRLFKIYVK